MSRIITYSQIILKGSLSLLIILNLGSIQALAGGSDDPNAQPPETFDPSTFANPEFYKQAQPSSEVSAPSTNTNSSANESNQNRQTTVISSHLDWDQWSQPYWLNNQVCREQSGNIACFESSIAQQFGWNIPSQN
jgi:hypothetical protein